MHVGPKRKTPKTYVQNVTVIDQGMNPTTLTLWDQFTQHEAVRMPELTGLFPVVMGVKLKINASYDTILETKGSTIFNFDPPLLEANVLRTWCLAHSTEIQNHDIGHLNQIEASATPVELPFERQIIKINHLPMIVSEAGSSSDKKLFRKLFIEEPPSNFSGIKDEAAVVAMQPVADDFVPPKQKSD
ncbi:hypothetical protein RHGRI_031008 [Rhododendron griersonianum]|uniref:Uncharacterized protein n=1 Tax=Rhododendron griersonianum TaxID=479676 RepID=A0AAV6I6A3_9ERIC|nr:hypothetical protein RHGRI_031008 [Rhododendron griersonianum]